MTILEGLGLAVGEPLMAIWDNIVFNLPGFVAAVLILILGYLIGGLLGILVKQILVKTGLTANIINKMGLDKEIGKWNLPNFFGLITKWYVFLVFLNPAAQVVSWTTLSTFFEKVALWIPNAILAVVIVLSGYVLAEYLAKKIRETKAKENSMLAVVAKLVTIILVLIIALKQIGIKVDVAENAFLIILAGIMLAMAIAFGFGLKDEASSIIKDIKKRL